MVTDHILFSFAGSESHSRSRLPTQGHIPVPVCQVRVISRSRFFQVKVTSHSRFVMVIVPFPFTFFGRGQISFSFSLNNVFTEPLDPRSSFDDRQNQVLGSKNDEKVKVFRMGLPIIENLSGPRESIFTYLSPPGPPQIINSCIRTLQVNPVREKNAILC